jgi:hypothetical protein
MPWFEGKNLPLLVFPHDQHYDSERNSQQAEKRFRDNQLFFIRYGQ